MLTLTRKEGESLYFMLADGVDPKTPVGEIFGEELVVIRVGVLGSCSVRLNVIAPHAVKVLREELRNE